MRPSPQPPVDLDLAGLFASRGRLDADRYLQTRDGHDLDDAISNMRTAVALAKDTRSSILGPSLGNLAALLLEQFKSTGKDAGLNEARQLATWALECLSDDDTDRALILATLGNILTNQYDRSGRLQDLEEAMSSLQVAAQARSILDNSTVLAVVLNNFACILGKRYEITGRRGDINDAITSALEATRLGLTNHPSLMAGAGSTLASLLLRQYTSTGGLDSLANALFELRIVTEIAPDFQKLDTLLGHLGSLAMEQHALRAQAMDERIEVLQSLYPWSLTFFLFLPLSTVISFFFPRAFYPLVVFFGGIVSKWAFQKSYQPITSRKKSSYMLDFIPTWIQEIFYSPYDICARFTPTLFPTPWIDTPSTLTLPTSEEEPFNEDDVKSQSHLLYDLFADSKIWDGLNDSSSDSEPLRSIVLAFQEEENVDRINETKESEPSVPTKRITTTEDGITYSKNPKETSEKQVTISDAVSVSVRYPSKAELVTEVSPDVVQDDASEKQYKSPSSELSPIEAKSEAITTPNQRHPSHRDIQPTEDSRSTLGKDFVEQKVHSRVSPTKLDKEPSAFDSVAQGNTSNDIKKNEGNAMGNIYSEEAHVVGHLSRHYGDRFETKNISAVLPRYQNPDADQNLPDATFDKTHTEDIFSHEIIRDMPESESETSTKLERRLGRVQMAVDTLEPEQDAASKTRLALVNKEAMNASEESLSLLERYARGKSRSKKKHYAKTNLGSLKTKQDQELDSEDYLSNGRSASSKIKMYKEMRRSVNGSSQSRERSQPLMGEIFIPDWSGLPTPDDATAQDRSIRSNSILPRQPIAATQPKRRTKEVSTMARRTGGTSMPPPAPNLKNFETSSEQVDALSLYFQKTLLPLCTEYVRNVPIDQKTRELAHRKLSETIMTQVLLHADGIEVNDEFTRDLRRQLVQNAQSALKILDYTLRGSH